MLQCCVAGLAVYCRLSRFGVIRSRKIVCYGAPSIIRTERKNAGGCVQSSRAELGADTSEVGLNRPVDPKLTPCPELGRYREGHPTTRLFRMPAPGLNRPQTSSNNWRLPAAEHRAVRPKGTRQESRPASLRRRLCTWHLESRYRLHLRCLHRPESRSGRASMDHRPCPGTIRWR